MNQRIFGLVFVRTLVTITSFWAAFAAHAQTSSPLAAIAQVATGFSHSCAVSTSGGVFCWGDNAKQQLGRSTPAQSLVATNVPGLATGVQMVALGAEHTCALTAAGGVKCWGGNNYGQTGTGSAAAVIATPSDAVGLTSGVIFIASGAWHTCALTATNGVLCWGRNEDGQTGSGSISAKIAMPTQVSGLTSGVAMISSGGFYTCAQMMGGAVNCWGDNYWGYFGNGTTSDSSTPTPSPALQSVLSNSILQPMSAGYFNNCVITNAGGVKCFGDNSFGQLGVTNVTSSASPLDVPAWNSGVTRIATAANFACALTAADVQCLGDNSNGQLGKGTTGGAFNATPSAVTNLSEGVSQISAVLNHACAVTQTGGVKCWGANSGGQLGNNSIIATGTPAAVLLGEPAPVNLPIIFNEDFDGPVLAPAKWTETKFDSRANAGTLSFDTGRMLVAVPGGSLGSGGVSDGSDYTPNVPALTGDYDIVISGTEILRQQIGGYKDNSGLQLLVGNKTVVIAGNYSGYWFGVGYNEYNKHRIHAGAADGTSACVIDESLSLATMYQFDLSISRTGTAVQIGYRLNGGAWTYVPCGTQTGTVSPKIRVYSGDGGGTVQNGRFTVAVDSFIVRADVLTDGACGTADGVATATPPSQATLCSAGTPSAITTGTTNYSWTCSGTGGGTTASCSAAILAQSPVSLSRFLGPSEDGAIFPTKSHGDGHIGDRMSIAPSDGVLLIACSGASCNWTATTSQPWLKVTASGAQTQNGAAVAGTATSSLAASLKFSVDAWEGTEGKDSAQSALITISDGTATPKTWRVERQPLTDWDEDGVADEWEQRGYPYTSPTRGALVGNFLDGGLAKYNQSAPYGRIATVKPADEATRLQARSQHSDIWLWVDQMVGVSRDYQLTTNVLEKLADVFEAQGVKLRWVVADALLAQQLVDITNRSTSTYEAIKQTSLRPSAANYWRDVVYRHIVWASAGNVRTSQSDPNAVSEYPCREGQSTGVKGAAFSVVYSRNMVWLCGIFSDHKYDKHKISTLAHELGHELGLGHGGPWFKDRTDFAARMIAGSAPWKDSDYDSEDGNKVTHVSIMNYRHANSGGLITNDSSTRFGYLRSQFSDVDETNLTPFWAKPLIDFASGQVRTDFGVRFACGTNGVVESEPGNSTNCLDGSTPRSTDLDYADSSPGLVVRHKTYSEWDRLQFAVTPGFLGHPKGFGIAAVQALLAVSDASAAMQIRDEPPVESSYYPRKFEIGIVHATVAPKVSPDSQFTYWIDVENLGFSDGRVALQVRPSSNLRVQEVPEFTLRASARVRVPLNITVTGNATEGKDERLDIEAFVAGMQWTSDFKQVTVHVVPVGQGSAPAQLVDPETRVNDFAFSVVRGSKPDIYVESGSVTLTGFNVPIQIQVRGGEMSINGGGWTHYISTVNPGDTLRLRAVSSTVAGEKRTVEVAVGGLVRAFEVTTSLDTDGDGVPDAVESAGPNNGDANGDGIPDKDQKNVGTIFSPAGNGYVTFEVSGGCSVAEAISAYTESQIAVQDTSWAYPLGLVSFRLPCSAATVRLYYHGVSSLTGYTLRRYGPTTPGNATTSAWTTVPNATFGTVTVGASTVATASYGLNDGQPGDDTGTDGVIVDPVGPALYVGGPVDANGNPIPVPTNDRSGLIMLAMMLLLAGGLSYRRHRKRSA